MPPGLIPVVASPSACWLVRRAAQQAVGLLSDEYYPVQYEDIDLCIRLGLAGWKIACECSVRVRHIGSVTTRDLKDYPFARLTVRRGMIFREKWLDVLPQIATLTDRDIYWGPIPRVRD
jgi:GT2 family glycosyltransferase